MGWQGSGLLGFEGEVDREAFNRLCDNRHPESGEQLTPRMNANRRVLYDFNFHVPKSVTLAYQLGHDEGILDAFQQAVRETMSELEQDMATRIRLNGASEDRSTGNMVWTEFTHFTARPIDGVPDPHLHSHVTVFNATYDFVEDRWKAGQFAPIKQDAPYFEALFHSKLADTLAERGYGIRRTAKAWELDGVGETTIRKFSRRTTQIDALADALEVVTPEGKAKLGATSREKKSDHLNAEQLQQEWDSRLDDAERASIAKLRETVWLQLDREDAARDALQKAAAHCFERSAVVPERALLTHAMKFGVGQVSRDDLVAGFADAGVLQRTVQGQRFVTTQAVYDEEQAMLRSARSGRGTAKPLGEGSPHTFRRDWLDADQKEAVSHLLESRDQVMLIRGVAGSGKTSLLQEAVEAIESQGKQVSVFAPSADASRGVLREEGFAEADTVAKLLSDRRMQEKRGGR